MLLTLMSDSQHKGSSAPSVRSQIPVVQSGYL